MELLKEQIGSAAQGVVRMEQVENRLFFHRMSEQQEACYGNIAHCTAGVRLEFQTDSRSLYLKVHTKRGINQSYFRFEVFCDGKRIGCLDNFDDDTPVMERREGVLRHLTFPLGDFEKAFEIGEGMKTVCIYFPWSVVASLEALRIDDGACFVPVTRRRKLLIYGDSITQGCDVRYPSQSYASRLTDALGAEGLNKAIGGDVFRPRILQEKEPFEPDYITVAYGTNDWHSRKKEDFERDCSVFFETLSAQYPQTPIFAITPIWRKSELVTAVGTLKDAADYIEKAASVIPNVTVLRGESFVPPETRLFTDGCLHPNDEGSDYYFHALLAALLPYVTVS